MIVITEGSRPRSWRWTGQAGARGSRRTGPGGHAIAWSGVPPVAWLPTIVMWGRFRGAGRANRRPTPAPGQTAALAQRSTAVRAADPVPAGGPDPGPRIP